MRTVALRVAETVTCGSRANLAFLEVGNGMREVEAPCPSGTCIYITFWDGLVLEVRSAWSPWVALNIHREQQHDYGSQSQVQQLIWTSNIALHTYSKHSLWRYLKHGQAH